MKKNKKKNNSVQNNTPTNEQKIDKSPIVYQKSKLRNELSIYERELTEKQKQFIEIALNKETKMVFVSGPAGTSKTYITIYAALKLLNSKKISDLLYIISAVESSDNKLGFLPGEAHEKMANEFGKLLQTMGYAYVDETDNPAYKLFLRE